MAPSRAPGIPEGRHPLLEGYAGLSVDAATAADLGIWRWDLESGQIQLSERLRSILGFRSDRFSGTLEDLLGVVHSEDRERVRGELSGAAVDRRPFSFQARVNLSDGGERTVLSQGRPSDLMTSREMVAVLADISAYERTAAAIERLESRLTHIIAESPAMISIKGLDHRYRMINADVARLAGIPASAVLGHTASEVFPGIGPHIDAQAAEALVTRQTLHSDVELEVAGETRTFHLISFALTDHSGVPVEICCIAADVTDSRRQQEQARLRHETTTLIRSALREDRMVAVSQPVVDINGGITVSEELLVRLLLPDGAGLLQPESFLPGAERFRLVQDIDIWMLNRALEIAATRNVQVNLSAVTLTDPAARVAMIAALERAPTAARRVVFEITETAAADHLDAAAEFADALTALGCGLALDDFGTGFGSFTYLQRLPLRYLKIDRSFVSGLSISAHDRKVVASITSVAGQFGLGTIAEGVEDVETLRILGELGADFAQGFHLGHPTPIT